MAEFAFDLTWVGIVAVLGIISIVITKMLRPATRIQEEHYKKISKLDKDYTKRLEEENEELEKELRSLQNSLNRRERGPSIEGEPDELSDILPSLVEEFAPHAPKWMRPFLGDKEMQEWIIKYASEHPDKAKEWFSKFIGKKTGGKNEQKTNSDMLSV